MYGKIVHKVSAEWRESLNIKLYFIPSTRVYFIYVFLYLSELVYSFVL